VTPIGRALLDGALWLAVFRTVDVAGVAPQGEGSAAIESITGHTLSGVGEEWEMH
jgi:hypothetical protein